jgi:hypothetical protein
VRELATVALARAKRGSKHCAELGPGPAYHCGACAVVGGRRKVNAQHTGALRSDSFEVLGPLNQGYAVLLSLINDPSAQGITSWGEPIGVHMPDRQIAAMLSNKDEGWRGQLWFCVKCDSNGASERCLSAPEVTGEKDSITWPE